VAVSQSSSAVTVVSQARSPWCSPRMARRFRRSVSWDRSLTATTSRTRENPRQAARKDASWASDGGNVSHHTGAVHRHHVGDGAGTRMMPEQLLLQRVEPRHGRHRHRADGQPIEASEMPTSYPGARQLPERTGVSGGGGRRGLAGNNPVVRQWNLNRVCSVEQVPMVQIPIGYVGVVNLVRRHGARGCEWR